jgi:hydrogenase expression/formation protein HypE
LNISIMNESRILLAHGNGGRLMRELITDIFARHLANPVLDTDADAVLLPGLAGEIMVTTDGFTVQPMEFPGGNLGSLAVHGVVNDLAVAGAEPRYLTLSAIIEEGLEVALLDRLIASFAQAAAESGVMVAAGDTKVVRRQEGGGLYLAVAGIGVKQARAALSMNAIQPGDAVLVSGPVGDHGVAVMLAREQFGLSGKLESDSAAVLPLAKAIWNNPGLRFMRDPTRGGLATVTHEIALATGHTLVLQQDRVPVRKEVASVCEMLGYDPYYLACEGRIVAVAEAAAAVDILAAWRRLPGGAEAALIGRVETGPPRVILETPLGGRRVLEELEDDPLPRIC